MSSNLTRRMKINDLLFPHIDNSDLVEYLHHEISASWEPVDWCIAEKAVLSRINDLFSEEKPVHIAWYGWTKRAQKIFNRASALFSGKNIQWFLVSDSSEIPIETRLIERISFSTWSSRDFQLTINMDRHCPAEFQSFKELCGAGFFSPFIDNTCNALMWDAGLLSISQWLEKLKEDLKANRVIVFVALRHGNFPTIEHVAKGLREVSGVKAYGIYIESEIPDDVYDVAISCNDSLGLFAELLCRLPPLTIYLQAHARWAYLSQFIRAANSELKIVQEVYDWMGAFIADEQLVSHEGVFSPQQVKLMLQSEDFICRHIDGYIYKDGGAWMNNKVKRSIAPSLKIYPCPPASYFEAPIHPRNNAGIKLVYAGQISHKRQSKKIFGDMYYMPLIKDLTGQGFRLTLYNAVHHSRKHPAEYYKEYIDEAENSELFEFKKGIPMPGIINELNGRYHYGLIAYYFENDLRVGENHLKGTMASKLFTYLAAGIPVILSEQLEYMAEIVEKEGFGIVVSKGEIQSLADVLAKVNYIEMLENVRHAQEKYSIEAQLPKLCKMLGL